MKHIIFALLSLALMPGTAKAFIIPDTVDLRATPPFGGFPSTAFITNSSADTLKVDSISVPWMSIPSGTAQLAFYLMLGPTGNKTFAEYNVAFYLASGVTLTTFINSTPRRAVPPNTTADLNSPGFDYCVLCPTAKRAAVSAIGDTLKARVVFHSGAQRDSVLFLGIVRTSSSIMPFQARRRDPTAFGWFDLNGRKVPPVKAVPGSLPVPKR